MTVMSKMMISRNGSSRLWEINLEKTMINPEDDEC